MAAVWGSVMPIWPPPRALARAYTNNTSGGCRRDQPESSRSSPPQSQRDLLAGVSQDRLRIGARQRAKTNCKTGGWFSGLRLTRACYPRKGEFFPASRARAFPVNRCQAHRRPQWRPAPATPLREQTAHRPVSCLHYLARSLTNSARPNKLELP